jgi:hypothetical protein
MPHQLPIIKSCLHKPSLREHGFFGQEQVLVQARTGKVDLRLRLSQEQKLCALLFIVAVRHA